MNVFKYKLIKKYADSISFKSDLILYEIINTNAYFYIVFTKHWQFIPFVEDFHEKEWTILKNFFLSLEL